MDEKVISIFVNELARLLAWKDEAQQIYNKKTMYDYAEELMKKIKAAQQ